MSKKTDAALAMTIPCPGKFLSNLSASIRKRSQKSQDEINVELNEKPPRCKTEAVTPAVNRCRVKGLNKEVILQLIEEHQSIAKWYALDFLRETEGLNEEQLWMWDYLEGMYGVDFLQSYTQPIPGDIRAVFEPNFWFLQGKIHMLMWLLGQSLTEITFDNIWDEYLPGDLWVEERQEVSEGNESNLPQIESELTPPHIQAATEDTL
ncbi:MAG: hypothetical protein K8U57_35355 [Planctomycetes bacterium]|nr:hypothetical protein [Planctomycetota bacterium]